MEESMRTWQDNNDNGLRFDRRMLLIPVLFIIGCIVEVMIG
jgi:hypothetical protein